MQTYARYRNSQSPCFHRDRRHTNSRFLAKIQARQSRDGSWECDHLLEEAKHVWVGDEAVPVEPGGLVVYVIGFVLAVLGLQKLIPHAEHRSAIRQKQETAEILDLLLSCLHDLGRHTDFAIWTSAVPALLRVARVRDLVIQGKTVVRCDVVETLEWTTAVRQAVREQVIPASVYTIDSVGNAAVVALYKTPNCGAKPVIPLPPI